MVKLSKQIQPKKELTYEPKDTTLVSPVPLPRENIHVRGHPTPQTPKQAEISSISKDLPAETSMSKDLSMKTATPSVTIKEKNNHLKVCEYEDDHAPSNTE